MSTELHCDRLPDIPITLIGGGTIDLTDFCGQKLIVFFCPDDDPGAAAREIEDYRKRAVDFEHAGAWVIGIDGAGREARSAEQGSTIHLGVDPDGAVFRTLAGSIPEYLGIETTRGATFVIDRDNGVRAAWPGCGHVAQALEIARERP
jgi:peroxiredoxin